MVDRRRARVSANVATPVGTVVQPETPWLSPVVPQDMCNEALALTLIFDRLSPSDLAKCRGVSKLWREHASSMEVRRSAFVRHWRLGSLVGELRNPVLLESASLSHFVRRHAVQRSDSLQAVAVRYGSCVTAIKRLNNIMSDHSLHSRTEVYVPVSETSELAGANVQASYCRIACRDLFVLLSTDEAQPAQAKLEQSERTEEQVTKSRVQADALRDKLVGALSRSHHLDDATARYYLAEAAWCLKAAMQLCEQDLAWEVRNGGQRRRAPLKGAPR